MKKPAALMVSILVAVAALGMSVPARASVRTAASRFWPRESWQPVAIQGFGAVGNASAGSMVEFRGNLYAGTMNEASGGLVVRKGASSWSAVSAPGFGDAQNRAVTRLEVHDDRLYAGTVNLSAGCEVWRYDGAGWDRVLDEPEANLAVTAMASFEGELYVGITNYDLRSAPPSTSGPVVKRYDGVSWHDASSGDFAENPQYNAGIGALEEYGGYLYAATVRFSMEIVDLLAGRVRVSSRGFQVYSTPGAAGYRWSRVGENGITDTRNIAAFDMEVYEGKLFLATTNGDAEFTFDILTGAMEDFTFGSSGLCVYSYDGASFRQEVRGGFSGPLDCAGMCLETATCGGSDYLLVGVVNSDGSWSLGKLLVYDGANWEPGAFDGFGDPGNGGVTSLLYVPGEKAVYAGTANVSTGCQVWRLDLSEPASDVWYLAEGCSDWGFDTYVTIENPNSRSVPVRVTYMTASGPRPRPDFTLPAASQTVINPRDDIGAADFSTRVECLEAGLPIAVDRRMIWTGPGAASPEGHCSIGVTCPASSWYLPEGSTKWGFETWLLIQNPNDREASCDVTYMIEGRDPVTVKKKVAAASRASFDVGLDVGAEDASIMVRADVPVIPERAMYRNGRREGHSSIGTTTPAKDYYLAEGTTGYGFTTYVLVQNPQAVANTVTVVYMTDTGPVAQPSLTMPANSRKTLRVNDVLPGRDVSVRVSGDLPLIAERAMYWDAGRGEACHDSIGMSGPHSTFQLPDGETQNGHETWTLVQNPNAGAVEIEVQYLTLTGQGNVRFTDSVPGGSRRTYDMSSRIPSGRAAVQVRCLTTGKKVMCERAMYWNSRGAGTGSIGGYWD